MEVSKKQLFEQKNDWSVFNILSWFAKLGFAFYRATDVKKSDNDEPLRKRSTKNKTKNIKEGNKVKDAVVQTFAGK